MRLLVSVSSRIQVCLQVLPKGLYRYWCMEIRTHIIPERRCQISKRSPTYSLEHLRGTKETFSCWSKKPFWDIWLEQSGQVAGRMYTVNHFEGDKDDLVLDPLTHWQPMERPEHWSDVIPYGEPQPQLELRYFARHADDQGANLATNTGGCYYSPVETLLGTELWFHTIPSSDVVFYRFGGDGSTWICRCYWLWGSCSYVDQKLPPSHASLRRLYS